MNVLSLARFFVRFTALCFLLYVVVDLTQFGLEYHYFTDDQFAGPEGNQRFAAYILCILVQVLAAVILFGKTDALVGMLSDTPSEPKNSK